MNILYRDNNLVAVNKPAGLLVQRSNIDRHETQFAVQMLSDQLGRMVFPAKQSILFCATKPETVRKHPLRRHMTHIFHPIVGDTNHGDGHQLLLAATTLSFRHPYTEALA